MEKINLILELIDTISGEKIITKYNINMIDIILECDILNMNYKEMMNLDKEYKKINPNSKIPKLLIAGEFYQDRKLYDELIEQLNIKDQLILKTDFIPDSEVKYYLCAADVVIQPYRSATQSALSSCRRR